MPYIKANKTNLYYEIHGKGNPLVLVTGYCGNTFNWSLILNDLKKHFQCLIFDNRGTGLSDVPDGTYSVEDMAADTIDLINKLGFKKTHIYGNSLGGAIVQTMAYKYSDQIDRVIIGNSTAKFNAQMLFAAKNFIDYYEKNSDLLEQAKLWLPILMSENFITHEANLKAYFENSINNPKPISLKGMIAQYAGMHTFDSRKWVDKITHRCLILSGDEDLICLPKESQYLHEHIKNSQLHIFKHCGHLPHIEYPQLNNEIIMNFLQG
ncbi:MAG: hypothetical protein A2103_02585 [Gammaproteobacteria bacterium GWF2_41_13]|nr:MAG: hypothetical protein A2103_02585 [Gammaproteobacteria bacterium GWF2_41_13]